jgi:hypothetical protein
MASNSHQSRTKRRNCVVCGEPFEPDAKVGRPSARCPEHRGVDRHVRPAADGSPPDHPDTSAPAESYRDEVRDRCLEAFGEDAEGRADAIERYAVAVELERVVYNNWVELGCPSTTLGGASGKTLVEHPLIAAIIKSSAAAARLDVQLGISSAARRTGPGRLQGTLRAPDRVSAHGEKTPRLTRLTLATD